MDRLSVVITRIAPLLLSGAALGGCADGGAPACRVGADCASGVCLGDGTCAAGPETSVPDSTDTAEPDTSSPDTANDTNDLELASDAADTDTAPGLCVPVDDGRITRAEVPLRAGLHATFRIATDAAVDLAGERDGDLRTWHLEGPYPGDSDVRVDLLDVTGSWFSTDFPGATYAARLSTQNDYLGVFEVTDDALLLRGVVSPDEGVFATELTYDPPVAIYRFPLALGDTWTTSTTATGLTLGVASLASEDYASEADAAGELVTPFGRFPVLRVRTTLTRTIGFVVTTVRQVAFVSPCFGTVALAVSRTGETQAEFGTAAEVRRLAP